MPGKTHPNRIGELRSARGLKREELAVALRVNPSTVRRWETGAVDVPPKWMHVLAEFFGVSIPWLMCWEDRPPLRRAEAMSA